MGKSGVVTLLGRWKTVMLVIGRLMPLFVKLFAYKLDVVRHRAYLRISHKAVTLIDKEDCTHPKLKGR